MSDIKILDACCGSRMFWFDKNERHTTFMDIRQETLVKKYHQDLLDEVIPVDKKPDVDNYEKALYDSMSGIVFKDDGQIALHDVGKFYSLNPRIEVEIEEIK